MPAVAPVATPTQRKETNRDIIDQIVFALVLALLFRGFEAEAFVIPTGSMAPTLLGRHKDVTCPTCGVSYRVNASHETEGRTAGKPVILSTCPNCVSPVDTRDAKSFKGDRILVMKSLYELPFLSGGGEPSRWDVVVFRFPEIPETNYIKRLVGLPGDELRIRQGNIYTRKAGTSDPFRPARRPLRHQDAMQQAVWDDSHLPAVLADKPDWHRWRESGPTHWSITPSSSPGYARSYASPGGPDWSELRYEHRVPSPRQWVALLRGDAVPGHPRSSLVTDFYAYNSAEQPVDWPGPYDWYVPNWTPDLTLAASVKVAPTDGASAPPAQLRLELIKGGVPGRALINLATGQATLYHGDQPLGSPAATVAHDGREHDYEFANVDDRLTLRIDGSPIFGDGLPYADVESPSIAPTAEDLQPARIAVQGAAATVSGLVLKRDLYYTQDPGSTDVTFPLDGPTATAARSGEARMDAILELYSDPQYFPQLIPTGTKDFVIRPAHYMMLGDNSPSSSDSRKWSSDDQLRIRRVYGSDALSDDGTLQPATLPEPTIEQLRALPRSRWSELLGNDWAVDGWDPELRQTWEVPRGLLVGKAFFIYWPHAVPFWPSIQLLNEFWFPFRPQVERMQLIR
jgi:signal peptidase I